MVNRKATKKSRSEVMKDYRKKNKAKIIEYEKLRNERRKLERLKKKVEKYGQPSTSEGPVEISNFSQLRQKILR